jgi:hypothetical protein
MAVEYGCLAYDVPIHRKSVYKRLRDKMRQKCLMLSWSVYLIPWGMCGDLDKIISRINTAPDGTPLPDRDKVRYSIFKFDEVVSGQALATVAKDALQKMISNSKAALIHTVNKALAGEEEDSEGTDDPITTANAAVSKARKYLEDAQALALAFALTDDMQAGFLAYIGFIDAKAQEIKEAQENIKQVSQAAAAKATKPATVAPKPTAPAPKPPQMIKSTTKPVTPVKPVAVKAVKPIVVKPTAQPAPSVLEEETEES